MRFTAKSTDLKLELITLNGEELVKDCDCNINAVQASLIIKKLDEGNKEIISLQEKGEIEKVAELLGGQLADIYGGSSKWWCENFDFPTLVEIKQYVVLQLSGIKKNDTK